MTSPSPLRSPASYGVGFFVKLGLLGVVDAVGIYSIAVLVDAAAWGFVASLVAGLLVTNYVYLSRRTKASRWILPGALLMAVFVVWPILYSFYISLTNWSTGNILTRDQVIAQVEQIPNLAVAGEGQEYDLFVYSDDAGGLRFWLATTDGQIVFGEPRQRTAPVDESATEDPEALGTTDEDGDGVPETIGPFRKLLLRDLFSIANDLETLVLDLPGGGEVQPLTVSRARLIAGSQRYAYDAATATLTDAALGVTCSVQTGGFVCDEVPVSSTLIINRLVEEEGRFVDPLSDAVCTSNSGDGLCSSIRLSDYDARVPGWRDVVGLSNFSDVLTNSRIRGPLVRVFTWNIAFATLSVALTLALGLALATALQDESMKGRALYRSALIIPYAVPPFISALVWRGLFNDTFGQVNRLFQPVYDLIGADPIPWLLDGTWAKVTVLIVNLWLGFPYMFLITTGALQSIPSELKEAARVDGAGAFRVFRSVTFPLMLVSISPLLIGSFAFNFNNFVLIFLLTQGGPPVLGSAVPVGHTDILISFTFDVAVQSGRGNNFGLGSALTILIFLIVALISALSFRATRRLEDIYA